jgi:hypothetical protein
VLRTWQAGADFDAAAGPARGWQAQVRNKRQVQALAALLKGMPPKSDREAARQLHHRLLRYARRNGLRITLRAGDRSMPWVSCTISW